MEKPFSCQNAVFIGINGHSLHFYAIPGENRTVFEPAVDRKKEELLSDLRKNVPNLIWNRSFGERVWDTFSGA